MYIPDNLIFNFVVQPVITFILVVSFGFGRALPGLWIVSERQWWKLMLGNSTASQITIMQLEEDFVMSIAQREIDQQSPRPLAVTQAILIRLTDILWNGLTKNAIGMKDEKITRILESAIDNLNSGWRRGVPYDILYKYIKIIEDSAYDKAVELDLRIKGLCTVAVVKYALGNIKEGHAMGERNWKEANLIEQKSERLLKTWMAAYGFIYSKMFLGHVEKAMKLMAEQWNNYYVSEDNDVKENIKLQLNDKLILNPILSLPRHIILAATFKEPKLDKMYFPSEEIYENYKLNETSNKLENEILWGKLWYRIGLEICEEKYDAQGISRNLTHAYAAFYFTLLLQDVKDPNLSLSLRQTIREAFDSIDESAPIPARYAKHGFKGIYHLVRGRDEEALDSLRHAATFSNISGNRFADAIFTCCHSLAAARFCTHKEVCLAPEIDYYLKVARKMANRIGGNFYPALYAAAYSSICKIRGNEGEAKRYLLRSSRGSVGERILKIFRNDD